MSIEGKSSDEIKPIPTLYRGRWFRSRLEARWGLFFDEIGIRYRHEPEGFQLSDGRKYLPDFYLPQIHGYVEVKPDTKELPKQLWAITEFVMAGMGEKILFLVDEPDFKPYMMIRPVHLPDGVSSSTTNVILDIHYKPLLLPREGRLFEDVPDYCFEREEDFTIEYRQAVYLARSARFDHGQEGVSPALREQIKQSVRLKAFGDIA